MGKNETKKELTAEELKAKTEQEAKVKAEADAKAKAEKEAKANAKAEADAKAKAKQAAKARTSAKDTKLDELIASYRKAYPKERAFHVTSDHQVFLKADHALAKMHQRGVDKEKSVQTIEVK